MTALWGRLALIFLALFTLLIALIHSRPYDDSALRAFLVPSDGCSPPCFMGIWPGETTVQDAAVILEGHLWVRSIARGAFGSGIEYIRWTWNGSQPDFFSTGGAPALQGDIEGKVERLFLPIRVSPVEIWQVYGQPLVEIGCLPYCEGTHYTFAYPEQGMHFSTSTESCVRGVRALVSLQNTLYFSEPSELAQGTNQFSNFHFMSLGTISGTRSYCPRIRRR